jgi:hypothetical protein
MNEKNASKWALEGIIQSLAHEVREFGIKVTLRIIFGAGPLQLLTAEYESRLDTWRRWEPVSTAAHGTPVG